MAMIYGPYRAAADEALRRLMEAPDEGETEGVAASARAAAEFLGKTPGPVAPTITATPATRLLEYDCPATGWRRWVGGDPARLTLEWPVASAGQPLRAVFIGGELADCRYAGADDGGA